MIGDGSPTPIEEVEGERDPSREPLFQPSTESDALEQARAAVFDEFLKVHEYERQRLGQELHDSAGQLLCALHLSVAHLRNLEPNSEHEGLIDEIQDTVRQIDKEIRSLAFLNYPAELGDRSLCSALQTLALGFGRRTGIETTFQCVGDSSPVDGSVSTAVLRVAQEALVNVHRHAHAASAVVVLERRIDELRLTVSDDGVGVGELGDSSTVKGIGLQGMRHRVESLGGRFEIASQERGARVYAIVPLAAA